MHYTDTLPLKLIPKNGNPTTTNMAGDKEGSRAGFAPAAK